MKCFRVVNPYGLYGAEWDERFCGLCNFFVVFAMSAFFAILVALWYPYEGFCDNKKDALCHI